MLFIMFQTFAYMQIMSMINVRRPSYRDINPLSGINTLTVVGLVLLLVLQFSLGFVAWLLGYGGIDAMTNLKCLGVAASTVLAFIVAKIILRVYYGLEEKETQAYPRVP